MPPGDFLVLDCGLDQIVEELDQLERRFGKRLLALLAVDALVDSVPADPLPIVPDTFGRIPNLNPRSVAAHRDPFAADSRLADVLADVLGHLEHVDRRLAAEDLLQLFVGVD